MTDCKKCGRLLKSAQSIEDGYGPTCLRITNLNNNNNNKIEQVDFLGYEINMIKRQLQELRISPTQSKKYHDDPIERIREEELKKIVDPIIAKARDAFAECFNELRGVLETRRNEIERKEKEAQEKKEILVLEAVAS